jgi:AGZA family xanthine/uracil permease-like MFS transporter
MEQFAAAGILTVSDELAGKMLGQGIFYRGLEVLGNGSMLAGLVLGATAVCIIDRQLLKAAGFTLAGATMTFFGLMHASAIGIAKSPMVSSAYLLVSVLLAICAKYAAPAAADVKGPQERGEDESVEIAASIAS